MMQVLQISFSAVSVL